MRLHKTVVELALKPTGKEMFKFIQDFNRSGYARANMIDVVCPA